MAAISGRPWAALCAVLALSLGVGACSLVNPPETPVSGQALAERLVQEGRHAEAARAYGEGSTDAARVLVNAGQSPANGWPRAMRRRRGRPRPRCRPRPAAGCP